jgi:hypothetical protein
MKDISQEFILNSMADELWQKLRDILQSVSKKYEATSAPQKLWIMNETWKLIQERSWLKAKGLQNNNRKYNSLCDDIRKAIRRDKDSYIARICEEIEQHSLTNEPRDLFQEVKQLM